jgi:hypothetical protein
MRSFAPALIGLHASGRWDWVSGIIQGARKLARTNLSPSQHHRHQITSHQTISTISITLTRQTIKKQKNQIFNPNKEKEAKL